MSKKAATTTIAYDATDLLETSRICMGWIESLSWAINKSLSNNNTVHAARLADAAQYLAHEHRSILESEIKSFNERLDALDAGA